MKNIETIVWKHFRDIDLYITKYHVYIDFPILILSIDL